MGLTDFLGGLVGYTPAKPVVEPLQEDELKANLQGKDVLVVGGTKGIGYAVAESLAKREARVVIVGRSPPAELPTGIEFVKGDLSTVKGCREVVASGLKNRTFDTIVFCVGIITRPDLTRNSEGIEEDLMVSYLSRFVIARDLLNAQALVGRKRMFIVGYPGQEMAPTDVNDMNFEKTKYKQLGAHMNTVIFNEALVYEVARRFPDVHTYGLNPGLIATGIRTNVWEGGAIMSKVGVVVEKALALFNISAEQYSEQTIIHLLASPELSEKTAISFSQKGHLLQPGKWIADEANRIKVWENSEKLVETALSAGK